MTHDPTAGVVVDNSIAVREERAIRYSIALGTATTGTGVYHNLSAALLCIICRACLVQ